MEPKQTYTAIPHTHSMCLDDQGLRIHPHFIFRLLFGVRAFFLTLTTHITSRGLCTTQHNNRASRPFFLFLKLTLSLLDWMVITRASSKRLQVIRSIQADGIPVIPRYM